MHGKWGQNKLSKSIKEHNQEFLRLFHGKKRKNPWLFLQNKILQLLITQG